MRYAQCTVHSLLLSAVLYANLLSHFYLWFSRCHTRPPSSIFYPKKNRNKTYTQTQEKWNKINWQFEHLVLAARFEWDSGTGRQNKSKQSKHMKHNRSTDQNRILAIANAATARKLSVRFRFRFRLPELALTTRVGSKQHPILTSGWRYFWQ